MGFIHRDFKKAFDEVPLFPHGVEVPLAFSLFLCTVHLNVYFSIVLEQNLLKIDRNILGTILQALPEAKVRFQPFGLRNGSFPLEGRSADPLGQIFEKLSLGDE